MPAIMEQISKMSREEQLRIASWILDGIRNGVVTMPSIHRSIKRNPALAYSISDDDLFADESELWETAK